LQVIPSSPSMDARAVTERPSKPDKYGKPISLAPLSFADALRGAATTGPLTDDKPAQPEPAERKVTKTWRDRRAASAKRAKRKD
jgi:hypothetical protein